jgi:hypothetical protein
MPLARFYNQTAAAVACHGIPVNPNQYALNQCAKKLHNILFSHPAQMYPMPTNGFINTLLISFLKKVACRGVTFCQKNTLYNYRDTSTKNHPL